MSRRNIQLFSLSFLDLVTGALGAVIFLFVITPKAEFPGSPAPRVAMFLDTVNMEFYGSFPDSLKNNHIGDTLIAIVANFDHRKKPRQELVKDPVREQVKPVFQEPAPKQEPKKETPVTPQTDPNPVPVIKEEPKQKETPPPPIYKGDAPSVPCKVSLEVNWPDIGDNVDFFVCKSGDCVYGGDKKSKDIGEWDSGKSRNRLFGNDLRTNQEAVRQFDRVIPGNYELFAQFKESKGGRKSIQIKGLIYTKGTGNQERGEAFSKNLTISKDRVPIGKLKLNPDGSFIFIPL